MMWHNLSIIVAYRVDAVLSYRLFVRRKFPGRHKDTANHDTGKWSRSAIRRGGGGRPRQFYPKIRFAVQGSQEIGRHTTRLSRYSKWLKSNEKSFLRMFHKLCYYWKIFVPIFLLLRSTACGITLYGNCCLPFVN